jgi:hypothetical protein
MNSTVAILSLTIGLPMLLLAVGVLYHAYVLGRQPAALDELEAHVEAMATESTDALLIDLQEAVERMQGQLARQRESLAGLLSDEGGRPRSPALAMAPAVIGAPTTMLEPELPRASGEPFGAPVTDRRGSETPANRAPGAPIEGTRGGEMTLASSVARLVSEGLSDRAIARQLHVGLEEVRMARMRGPRS